MVVGYNGHNDGKDGRPTIVTLLLLVIRPTTAEEDRVSNNFSRKDAKGAKSQSYPGALFSIFAALRENFRTPIVIRPTTVKNAREKTKRNIVLGDKVV